jgi:hypothetical protein
MEAESAPKQGGGRKKHAVRYGLLSLLAEMAVLWHRGYHLGGNVTVRCRDGHTFTTIWIPGVSLKSLRLGWWRFQRCPVGGHWSLVTPVDKSELSWPARRRARRTVDIRIP